MNKMLWNLVALWLVVLVLIGLRVFEFYEGDGDTKQISTTLWKIKRGQDKILEHIKFQDSYDDD